MEHHRVVISQRNMSLKGNIWNVIKSKHFFIKTLITRKGTTINKYQCLHKSSHKYQILVFVLFKILLSFISYLKLTQLYFCKKIYFFYNVLITTLLSFYAAISFGNMQNGVTIFCCYLREVTILEWGVKHWWSAIWKSWIWPLSGCFQMIKNICRMKRWGLKRVGDVFGADHLTQRDQCSFLLGLVCIILCLVVAQDSHNGHEHSQHIWQCDRVTQEQKRNRDDGDSFCGICNSIGERSHMV